MLIGMLELQFWPASAYITLCGGSIETALNPAEGLRNHGQVSHAKPWVLASKRVPDVERFVTNWSQILRSEINMNLDDLKVSDLLKLASLLGSKESNDSHWEIGSAYFLRTVTHHYTGKLVKVTDKELVLGEAAWIADDGRFSDFLISGEANEVEPYPSGLQVIIGRGSLVDAVKWTAKLPRDKK